MLTRHVTLEEAETLTSNREQAVELQDLLNKIIDERGYISFSDVKYCLAFIF